MKILVGIEDSMFSYNAARSVAQRPWHPGTQVRLISAVEPDLMSDYAVKEQENVYQQASAYSGRMLCKRFREVATVIIRDSLHHFLF
jgi:hypothetical protein